MRVIDNNINIDSPKYRNNYKSEKLKNDLMQDFLVLLVLKEKMIQFIVISLGIGVKILIIGNGLIGR